jgi:hypothetical protein
MAKVSRYDFGCGAVETVTRAAGCARITLEHGVYIVRRAPWHPAGWRVVSCRTIGEARRLAAGLAAGRAVERIGGR